MKKEIYPQKIRIDSNLTKQIQEYLELFYGLNASTINKLPLGADLDAVVYKAQTEDGYAYFVKVKRGQQDNIGPSILQFLHNAGVHHICPSINTLTGQTTLNVANFSIMVFPYITGQDGFNRDLTESQWYEFGKALRQIHDAKVDPLTQSKIRKEYYSSQYREEVRALYDHIKLTSHNDHAANIFISLLLEHKEAIHQIVDRSEHLAKDAQVKSAPLVLCHSDIHAGNILINTQENLTIVDWDDPIMAPKEQDLMFIGGGVGNVWNKPFEIELFYKGYGEIDINKMLLAYYRFERINKDIAEYGRELLLTPQGGKERIKWCENFEAQFAPQGVVEIAFETGLKNE